MPCPTVSAFFSCSFRDEDQEINEYFKSLCGSLRISCVNVSDGYAATPPEEARKSINDSKVVIAVIPKRDQIDHNSWTMPSAVHEEIAMAFALKRPTLIVVEKGVSCDGFISNFGTYIVFERQNLYTNNFIAKMVSSLHQLRLEVVDRHNMLPNQDLTGFYAEETKFLIELNRDSGQPSWHYTNVRHLKFTREFAGPLMSTAWVDSVPESATEKIQRSIQFTSNRSDLKYSIQTTKDTPRQLEIGVNFEPKPQKDDWIVLEFSYSSPYLNPLSKSELTKDKLAFIGSKAYHCFDGMVPIQPTHNLHVQIRFPAWYPVDKETILPFVGSYSNGVDYLVESEMRRSEITTNKFGSVIQVDIKVESPLLRHVYGFAWNLTR